jgi:hypothetical protein
VRFVNNRRPKKKTKNRTRSSDPQFPATLIAAMSGAAMFQYTEFVYMSSTDNNGQPANIPIWRVHMGSVCLGSIGFVIALFCFEVLEKKSKSIAFNSAIRWLPLVALTGLASIIHIPAFIVIIVGFINGMWVYRRSRVPHPGQSTMP